MKNLLVFLVLLGSFSASAQITAPYNPDSEPDGVIGASDVLQTLAFYGSSFTPDSILFDGISLDTLLNNLLQMAIDQGAVIEELQAQVDSLESLSPQYDITTWTFDSPECGTGMNCDISDFNCIWDGYFFNIGYYNVNWRAFTISGAGVELVEAVGIKYVRKQGLGACPYDGSIWQSDFWQTTDLGQTPGLIRWNHVYQHENPNGYCGEIPELEGGSLVSINTSQGCNWPQYKRDFEVLVKIEGKWRPTGFIYSRSY